MNSDDAMAQAETEAWADYYKQYISPEENPVEPMADHLYPIVDSSYSRVHFLDADGYNPNQHTTVGLIAASFYWRGMLRDLLPEGSNGIQIVFSNPCCSSFTYQIQGPSPMYLGVGDHHSAKYDSMGSHVKLHDLGTFAMRSSVYSGAPLDTEFCPYTLNVYPSDEMRASFISHNPILFTMIGVLIFAFTSLVFYLYDVKVQRRQDTVMRTAVRSTAIVSNLFPSAVRDRLYVEQPSPRGRNESSRPETAKGRLQSYLRDNRTAETVPFLPESQAGLIAGTPIAELYPDTTVLFADIAGFTAWSSTRTPTQVFQLLENLYAGFDEIAKKRGIFKVETIGDCYVAVVGLPTPRKHHAVAMARFANDCRNKMLDLTVELEKFLGPVRNTIIEPAVYLSPG
jgi:Adenylate and Guanylate cyclase catalytic domain